jgi:hypothetical protein
MDPKFHVGQVVATRYKPWYARVIGKSKTPDGWQYELAVPGIYSAEEVVKLMCVPEFLLRCLTPKEQRGLRREAAETPARQP